MADYIGKQRLLAELEEHLKSVLTVTDLEKTQSVMLQLLNNYDVERKPNVVDALEASKDFLDMFLDAKSVEGRTDKTLYHYRYILNQFFHYENIAAQDATVYNIRHYFKARKKDGMADSTIAGYRDVLNSFYGWLHREGLIRHNPCGNVSTIKVEKKVRKPFTMLEINKILDACEETRDEAIVLFLLNSGCRVSEMCSLHVGDVDIRERECVVYGKGKKERNAYFDRMTAEVLEDYLDERRAKDDEFLFTGRWGEPLTPNGVRLMLKRVEKKCGVENIHPHRFRRTLATNMINRETPIQEVAAILGHEKLDTTMKYVYQTKERTKASYERFTS